MVDLAFVYFLSLSPRRLFLCRAQGDPCLGGANGFNRRSAGVNRSLEQSEDNMKCGTYALNNNVDETQ